MEMEKYIALWLVYGMFVLAAAITVTLCYLYKYRNEAEIKGKEIQKIRNDHEKERRMTTPYMYPDCQEAQIRAYINAWVKKYHPGHSYYFEVARDKFIKIVEANPEYICFRLNANPTRYTLYLDKETGKPKKVTPPPVKNKETSKKTSVEKNASLKKTIKDALFWVESDMVTKRMKEAMASKEQTVIIAIPVELQTKEVHSVLEKEFSQWGNATISETEARITFV